MKHLKPVLLLSLTVLSAVVILSCGGRHPQIVNLEGKIDSIKRLEAAEQLRASGIGATVSDDPLQSFFDSLNIQPLPISYSDYYMSMLPGYTDVPERLLKVFGMSHATDVKAVALPDNSPIRCILLSVAVVDDYRSLWLLSFTPRMLVADKICLFAPSSRVPAYTDAGDGDGDDIPYFTITSDRDITVARPNKSGKLAFTQYLIYENGRFFEK